LKSDKILARTKHLMKKFMGKLGDEHYHRLPSCVTGELRPAICVAHAWYVNTHILGHPRAADEFGISIRCTCNRSTARPERHVWPRELWFSIYSCSLKHVGMCVTGSTVCIHLEFIEPQNHGQYFTYCPRWTIRTVGYSHRRTNI